VALHALTILLSWFAFLAGGLDPLDSLFEVVSAIGTVGLSTGIAGPDLATPLKFVLCLDMLMGRLEILAVLVLVYPRNWFGPPRRES
jgi:trk system potassium uptake protein TrkH